MSQPPAQRGWTPSSVADWRGIYLEVYLEKAGAGWSEDGDLPSGLFVSAQRGGDHCRKELCYSNLKTMLDDGQLSEKVDRF